MNSEDTLISGAATRYATALLSLAREQNALDAVGDAFTRLEDLIKNVPELKQVIYNPVFSVQQQTQAVQAVLDPAGIKGLAAQFVLFVTGQRRLPLLEDMIRAFRRMADRAAGIVEARVQVAHYLTDGQAQELQNALQNVSGASSVKIQTQIDPSLIGGMIVQMGSRMFDASLKTKLRLIHARMKGVG